MKRVFFILIVVLCTTIGVMAQEVHGIESKMVCTYDCNPDGSWNSWGQNLGYRNYEHEPLFSYEFTNMNSIPVSVEVELYHYEYIKEVRYTKIYDYVLKGTKSFVLQSGESYVWKNGNERGIARHNPPLSTWHDDGHKDYYVVYKAYKLQ